jgi:ATP-dependent helicase/nuclease subunit B
MTGGLTRSPAQRVWAQALDRPADHKPADRPAPAPPLALRPTRINVTEVDRLKADPFAFYARRLLKLAALDAVDADPSPAWRGTAVHAIFEAWMKKDGCDPDRLKARAEELLAHGATHPLMRALWQPRLLEAVEWTAQTVAANRAGGRMPLQAEIRGMRVIEGIEIYGIADRIDRLADGGLAVVDYKTGRAPSPKAVREGFAMQLGLLGLIADGGGFPGVTGVASAFEYWSLARDKGKLGYVASPVGGRTGLDPEEFSSRAASNFISAARKWLLGDEPFTAKLHPEHAPYGEYDQLMRLDEWYGRERGSGRGTDSPEREIHS